MQRCSKIFIQLCPLQNNSICDSYSEKSRAHAIFYKRIVSLKITLEFMLE